MMEALALLDKVPCCSLSLTHGVAHLSKKIYVSSRCFIAVCSCLRKMEGRSAQIQLRVIIERLTQSTCYMEYQRRPNELWETQKALRD